MNILYLNNYINIGGVTKCILTLSKELREHHNIIVATNGGPEVDKIYDLKLKYYKLANVESKSILNIIKNVRIISKIVKNERIDIIHSHHRMTTLLAKIVSNFTNVKVIHTQHLCIEDKFELTKFTLKNIQTITVSEAAKRILVEKSSLDANKIVTIYNTIEAINHNKEVDQRLIALKEQGYFIVAQVSRAVDYKGVDDFLEIANRVYHTNKNIKFIFIGDGPELVTMQHKIKDYGLEQQTLLLGSKDNVIEHLKYVDLFLLCSYIEGLPLSPLEAFSQKIPVIATNIDGTNEEVIDSYNGYLVEPKNVDEFASKIISIYNDNKKYNIFRENAYKTFRDTFNCENYINKHQKIYQQIMNK